MLRGKFLTTDLSTRATSHGERQATGGGQRRLATAAGHDAAQAAQLRQQLVDWAKGKVAAWGRGPSGRRSGAAARVPREPGDRAVELRPRWLQLAALAARGRPVRGLHPADREADRGLVRSADPQAPTRTAPPCRSTTATW